MSGDIQATAENGDHSLVGSISASGASAGPVQGAASPPSPASVDHHVPWMGPGSGPSSSETHVSMNPSGSKPAPPRRLPVVRAGSSPSLLPAVEATGVPARQQPGLAEDISAMQQQAEAPSLVQSAIAVAPLADLQSQSFASESTPDAAASAGGPVVEPSSSRCPTAAPVGSSLEQPETWTVPAIPGCCSFEIETRTGRAPFHPWLRETDHEWYKTSVYTVRVRMVLDPGMHPSALKYCYPSREHVENFLAVSTSSSSSAPSSSSSLLTLSSSAPAAAPLSAHLAGTAAASTPSAAAPTMSLADVPPFPDAGCAWSCRLELIKGNGEIIEDGIEFNRQGPFLMEFLRMAEAYLPEELVQYPLMDMTVPNASSSLALSISSAAAAAAVDADVAADAGEKSFSAQGTGTILHAHATTKPEQFLSVVATQSASLATPSLVAWQGDIGTFSPLAHSFHRTGSQYLEPFRFRVVMQVRHSSLADGGQSFTEEFYSLSPDVVLKAKKTTKKPVAAVGAASSSSVSASASSAASGLSAGHLSVPGASAAGTSSNVLRTASNSSSSLAGMPCHPHFVSALQYAQAASSAASLLLPSPGVQTLFHASLAASHAAQQHPLAFSAQHVVPHPSSATTHASFLPYAHGIPSVPLASSGGRMMGGAQPPSAAPISPSASFHSHYPSSLPLPHRPAPFVHQPPPPPQQPLLGHFQYPHLDHLQHFMTVAATTPSPAGVFPSTAPLDAATLAAAAAALGVAVDPVTGLPAALSASLLGHPPGPGMMDPNSLAAAAAAAAVADPAAAAAAAATLWQSLLAGHQAVPSSAALHMATLHHPSASPFHHAAHSLLPLAGGLPPVTAPGSSSGAAAAAGRPASSTNSGSLGGLTETAPRALGPGPAPVASKRRRKSALAERKPAPPRPASSHQQPRSSADALPAPPSDASLVAAAAAASAALGVPLPAGLTLSPEMLLQIQHQLGLSFPLPAGMLGGMPAGPRSGEQRPNGTVVGASPAAAVDGHGGASQAGS